MSHESFNGQPMPGAGGESEWDKMAQNVNGEQQPDESNKEEIRRREDEEPEVSGYETGEYAEQDAEKIQNLAESPDHAMTREEYEQQQGEKAA